MCVCVLTVAVKQLLKRGVTDVCMQQVYEHPFLAMIGFLFCNLGVFLHQALELEPHWKASAFLSTIASPVH